MSAEKERRFFNASVAQLKRERAALRTELAAVKAENERLRAALRPFADMADNCETLLPPKIRRAVRDNDGVDGVELRYLRQARAALSDTERKT